MKPKTDCPVSKLAIAVLAITSLNAVFGIQRSLAQQRHEIIGCREDSVSDYCVDEESPPKDKPPGYSPDQIRDLFDNRSSRDPITGRQSQMMRDAREMDEGGGKPSGNPSLPAAKETVAPGNVPADGYGCTSNPVEIATGAKRLAETDFVIGGAYGMQLTRTYRTGSLTGMFGVWRSNLQGMTISHHAGSNTLHEVWGSDLRTTRRTLAYDAVGNVGRDQRADGVFCYGHDGFNRKAAVYFNPNPQAACDANQPLVGWYKSNAFNQRAWKWTPSATTHFIHGPSGELLFEDGPTPTAYVWLGGELLGIHRHGTSYANHSDARFTHVRQHADLRTVHGTSALQFDLR